VSGPIRTPCLQYVLASALRIAAVSYGVIPPAINRCLPKNLHTASNCKELLSHMKIMPLNDRILVKRIKEDEKTKGGIIIPDTAKENPHEAVVLAVGKGKMAEGGKPLVPDVKAGDRILFGKYSGSEITLDAEDHLILREDDILGILEA
jgi:chaperonin GroES